jgi:hypothetical protein
MKLSQKNRSELILAWCFSIPCFVALFEIHTNFVQLEMHTGGGEQNAALFPRMLSYLLLVLIISKTFGILIEANKRQQSSDDSVELFEKSGRKRLAAISLVFILYIFGLSVLGYYVATPIALVAFFIFLGIRKVVTLVALSLGVSLAVWYGFGILLRVVLPVGRFGLYF